MFMNNKETIGGQSVAIIRRAFGFAMELGHGFVGSEHILWSLCSEAESCAAKALQNAGFDQQLVQDLIEQYDHDAAANVSGIALALTAEAESAMELAEALAKKLHHEKVEPEHLLLGILQEPHSAAAKLMKGTGADPDRIVGDLMNMLGSGWPRDAKESSDSDKADTKTLEQYSRDLTAMAREGKLDPVIGREKEIGRVVQILSRRTKNNPVLIGEPGVGKTAVAEGLAQRIVDGNIPKNLANLRILSLDLGKMLSGAKYRGDFEERLKTCLEETVAAEDVMLFIDELHTLIGTGAAEGSMDAANIFKPMLGRGEIQVIGATTMREYRKHIEKDTALERRFQPVTIDEPSHDDAISILQGLRPKYEEFHSLNISDEAIEAAVELSTRYIQDRYLPDKAIDLIDEAASRARTHIMTMPVHVKAMEEKIRALNSEKLAAVQNQNFEKAAQIRDRQAAMRKDMETQQDLWTAKQSDTIEKEDIAAVVSVWTGIPVTMLTQAESQRLLSLEETLHKRVVGQDEAVKAVSKAIRRSRVGIREPGKPIGNFLFLGPTGVGKTELCRALAEVMFQDESAIIRIDMSEYMERHTVSKLIGSPPGYVGYDEGGQLTEKVRRKPYSIVLFDEIEKAHPDVWNALLQIMDDGRLTDAQGRVVDFKNTIVVMTSNIGARDITGKTRLGFSSATGENGDTQPVGELRDRVMAEVKKTFQPEFLNRIDDIVVFHQLDRNHIESIARNLLAELKDRSEKLGIKLKIDDSAVAILAEKGFDPVYGARPLRRTIQSVLEDAIAEKMLTNGFSQDNEIVVIVNEGNIEIADTNPEQEKEPVTV